MPIVTCLCGLQLDAEDATSLNDAYWKHTDQTHSEFAISDVRRQNATDALLRTGGWDGKRARLAGAVDVRPLAAASVEDYLHYFDQDAFSDNPAWASCYCVAYNVEIASEEFDGRTAAQNRETKAIMIERGEATGVLAYSAGRVVGWCNAGPRTSFPLLDRYPEFAVDRPTTSGAIVCFVIAPAYRGQGLARKLLDGACDMLRARGLKTVFAYPPMRPGTDAGSYHGKLPMYLDAGFEETGAATSRYLVVSKSLQT